MDREFTVPPAGKPAMVTQLVLTLLVPSVMLIALVTGHTSKPPLQVVFMAALMAVIVAAIAFGLFGHLKIRIQGHTLHAIGGLFRRRVDLAELDLANARVLDLGEHVELRPLWRMFGVGLPGYRIGDYLTRERRRAFCLLTDFSRVLRIERRNGQLLLLSAEHPRELLKALQDSTRESTR